MVKKLTPKQAKFVQKYLVLLNATQAAIAAGYSPKTAAVIGSQNLTKLNVKAALVEQGRKALQVGELEVVDVIAGIRRHVLADLHANVRDLVD